MSTLFIAVTLCLLGLIVGSFAGATVWRLRARQLVLDKKNGERVTSFDKSQVEKIKKQSLFSDRSGCLHCGQQLKWYDMVPLVSWVYLNGKCRHCHKKIGNFEPIIELSMAAFFVFSYIFWPYTLETPLEVARLVLWVGGGVGLGILFAYDKKWFLLPDIIVYPLIGLGLVNVIVVLAQSSFELAKLTDILYACLVLSGLYYLIYVASNHKWVGFGDVKLGLVLALLLADWRLAILALFLANLIGTILVIPAMVLGKIKRQSHIDFGPLLIAGWFIAGLFGDDIIGVYLLYALGVS